MITIEPPSILSIPAPSRFGLKLILNLARSGASYLGSEMWVSPEGRPSFIRCKRMLLACLILLVPTLQAQSPNWQLTWSDEFNGTNGSPPDPAKWVIVTGGKGFGNNELETYTNRPANVQQQNGNLVITAQKEDLTGPDGIHRHYTSARLNTQGHFAQTYGRFEARIQLPTGKGIWPAFWLLGDNHETNHWPNCGEIDILETIGAPDTMYSTLHGPGYSGSKGISAKFPLPAGESVHDAFHLYAVEWAPNDIKFFFDDHLVAHRTPADLPPNTAWVYDHPFYILLNLAVGGNWPGNPDDTTTFPQQMLIDYVRVYSKKSEKPQPSATATKPDTPYLDSEMWASSEPGSPRGAFARGGGEGRPTSLWSNSHPQSKPPQ
jgi:beta-glucanase (GH16 family)